MSQLNNILSAKSSTKPVGSSTSHVRGIRSDAARASHLKARTSSSTRDLVDGCTSLTATARPRRRPLRASGVVSIRGRDDASMASRRRQSRSTRPRESLVLAPRRCRYHDCHKPWRTLRNAPPDVRDAARADRRAEDRITAGERVGERPQGFASRLRRARRAVLQEAAALAPSLGEDVGPRRRPLRELHGRRAAALDRVEDVAPPPLSQKRYQKCKRRPERDGRDAERPAS
mmetsp:Transcript_9948/g.30977  ORF Transcript_9948/g.30977 Transcript_9948/m.30977 type:complete len:231 (+) Transcript_9948:500-1192(+)